MTGLPAEPLLRQIALRGGLTASGLAHTTGLEQAYVRATQTGRITLRAADQFAAAVGLHPLLLWGDDWLRLPG
ncbi:hypothetical protein [Nocardioides nanhaiensis]|uniref:XRE family transcriptional regulator n=1 Tax=Nocardioides nanhaiensis TaxID=1476871 RepID=A0ABP8WZE3_9ACTN